MSLCQRRPVRARVLLTFALAVVLLVGVVAAPGAAAPPPSSVSYVPPVDTPVTDPFRPPSNPFGPGNRGLEYGTAAGDPVRASADGVVVFAGQVGGSLHVTVRHADGLRTSYSFLASLAVHTNDRVHQGDVLGSAGGPFHFGVRDPDDVYLDPALLFSGSLHPEVRLVPGPDDGGGVDRAAEVGALRAVVQERLVAAAAFGRRVAGDVADGWRLRVRTALDASAPAHLASIGVTMQGWYLQRNNCTPPGTSPRPPAGRRILVLVAGIGSSSDHGSIDDVDATALGYAPADVIRFSYRGGGIPSERPAGSSLAAVSTTTYASADTQRDLHDSAAALQDLLAAVSAAAPGVPIDVVAHSQGGVVSRLALQAASPPAEVQTLVTLSTPHHGANVATAIAAAKLDPRLHAALQAGYRSGRVDLDPDGPSVAQLAETSSVVGELENGPWPASVRLTSIGARGDLTVPAPRTLLGDGAASTVVPVSGVSAHDDLPGSTAAQREIALAVGGQPPTCRPFAVALQDALAAEAIDAQEDDLAATAAWAPLLIGPAVRG